MQTVALHGVVGALSTATPTSPTYVQRRLQTPNRCQRPLRAPCRSAGEASTPQDTATQQADAEVVTIYFKTQDVTTTARPGDNLADVAIAAGVDVSLGCNQGNCGVCELNFTKFSGEPGAVPSSLVVRSCITAIPRGYPRLEIDDMVDEIWGVDGFDT